MIHNADGDSDLLKVRTGSGVYRTKTTALVGGGKDLLVLLCHHAPKMAATYSSDHSYRQRAGHVHFVHEESQRTAQAGLGGLIAEISPLHSAVTRCNTTSRLYIVGKVAALNKFADVPYLFLSID